MGLLRPEGFPARPRDIFWNRTVTLGAYQYVKAAAADVPVGSEGGSTFDDLYRSHFTRMVSLARLMTDSLAVAEEVVQDAFVQVYRSWCSIEYPVTYLRIAVINGCHSTGRRRALERRHQTSESEPALFDTTAIAVREALKELPPRQRAAVVLRYFEDLSEQDIARALGCRPGTVKSLLSRSLTTLRRTLHD